MKTVETTVTVAIDGTVTFQLPPGISPGKHRIVLVIDEKVESTANSRAEIDAALSEMANDLEYQQQALILEAEFATAQWQAFQQAESDL
ncbi:hypothetical protein [Phormidesmis priestleyi]